MKKLGALGWLSLALVGCPSPAATDAGVDAAAADVGADSLVRESETGPVPDAFVGSDTGSSDTGPMVDTGPASADLAACRTAAAAYASLCTEDGRRVCHVAAYASFCDESGRPALYGRALDCLRMNSTSGSCRTFSDPSGSDTCIDPIYAGVSDAQVSHVVSRLVTLCETAPNPLRSEPPLFALSSTLLTTLSNCLDAATTCEAGNACILTTVAPIQACYL